MNNANFLVQSSQLGQLGQDVNLTRVRIGRVLPVLTTHSRLELYPLYCTRCIVGINLAKRQVSLRYRW